MLEHAEMPAVGPAGPGVGSRLRLTTEGLAWLGVALLLGAIGWYKSLNLVMLLSYLMLALLILNGLLAWAQVRRVVVSRVPLAPVYAGESARLEVRVRNGGRWAATVEVTDRLTGEPHDWLVYQLPGGGEVTCSVLSTFRERGRFGGTPLVVSSAYPLGFLRYDRQFADAGEVVVLPASGVADPEGLRHWVQRRAGGEGQSRRILRRVTNDQADVRGIRPYRHGDSIRSIHWRSSAKRGELMVREYDAAPSPELVIVVEPWLPARPTEADFARLEAALSLATTVVRTWCRHMETRFTVAFAGGQAEVAAGPPSEEFARVALTPLADTAGGHGLVVPAPTAFGRGLGRAARVVVSSRPGAPLAAALTRSTGRPFVAMDPTAVLPWYQPPG